VVGVLVLFEGALQTRAVKPKLPSVIATAHAAVFDKSVQERGVAMGAALFDTPVFSGRRAKDEQILTEDPQCLLLVGSDFAGWAKWLPIAS
jgi:hypothetical protein